MNFENIDHLSIDGKEVVRLECGDKTLWKGLPEGYRRVDYIGTTGNDSVPGPYIDTDFVPNQDSRVVCEFLFTRGTGIFGARTTTTSNNFSLCSSSIVYQFGYNATLIGSKVKTDANWHTVDFNKNIGTIDSSNVVEFKYAAFESPKTMIFGGINANNRIYYGSCKYRMCQIYDNGVLIRDFIPCINPEGKVGMYDTVFGVFYGNAGEGEFYTNETEAQVMETLNTYALNNPRNNEEFEEEI